MEKSQFTNPPSRYRVHQITHDWYGDFKGTLNKYMDYGIGGIVTNAPWDDEYMINSEKIKYVDEIIDYAKKQGFNVWLYDEKGFPSGTAGGLTLKNNPEFQALGLFQMKLFGSGKIKQSVFLPENSIKFVAATLYPVVRDTVIFDKGIKIMPNEKEVSFIGLSDEWVIYAYAIKYNYEGSHAENNGYDARIYPNLLNKKAVNCFINNTYKKYAENIKNLHCDIEAIFTDEPSLMAAYQNTDKEYDYGIVPWDFSLPEVFFDLYGYDLISNLNSLFEGDLKKDRMVRVNFYQTVGELCSNEYFGQISDWCEANGTKLSGHALLEENMVFHVSHYGNLYKCLKKMQFPGVDLLTTRPDEFLNDPFGYLIASKYVSSAARAGQIKDVMCEICPVLRTTGRLDNEATVEDLIGTANLLYFSGVNHINSYYQYDNYSKEHFSQYSFYVGRLGAMLRDAKNISKVGMYYSIETIQALYYPIRYDISKQPEELWKIGLIQHNLARELYKAKSDFNFIDDEQILYSTISQDSININTNAYTTIIMPNVKVLPLKVMQKLQQFEQEGGKVIWYMSKPEMGTSENEHEEVIRLSNNVEIMTDINVVLNNIPKMEISVLESGNNNIFISKYFKDEKNIFFLINSKQETTEAKLSINGVELAELFDPFDGKIESIEMPAKIKIRGNRGVFLVYNKH